jgi:hypothetical protein
VGFTLHNPTGPSQLLQGQQQDTLNKNPNNKTTMMNMTKILLTGIAAALAFSMTANAEDDADGKQGKGKGKRHGGPPKELVKKFDKDGDGKLDKEERAALKTATKKHRAATEAKMLERFDADKDGKLSDEEKKTARATMAKERKEIHTAVLAKFDKDKDGKLSKDEKKGVREWVKTNYPDAIHMRRGGKGGRGNKSGNKPGK